MKGYRFFQEFEDGPRGGKKSGPPKKSVIAVILREDGRGWSPIWIPGNGMTCEAIVGLYDEDNPPVTSGSVSYGYLKRHCRRVSEAVAREAHPKLFERLEA